VVLCGLDQRIPRRQLTAQSNVGPTVIGPRLPDEHYALTRPHCATACVGVQTAVNVRVDCNNETPNPQRTEPNGICPRCAAVRSGCDRTSGRPLTPRHSRSPNPRSPPAPQAWLPRGPRCRDRGGRSQLDRFEAAHTLAGRAHASLTVCRNAVRPLYAVGSTVIDIINHCLVDDAAHAR